MTTVDALLAARTQLETEYQKDLAAITHLLARLGYADKPFPAATVVAADKVVRTHAPLVKAGTLRDWVDKIFANGDGAIVSSPQIYDWAILQGATFASDRDKTIAAIGSVLRAMTLEGSLRLYTQGAGRRPSTYTKPNGAAEATP